MRFLTMLAMTMVFATTQAHAQTAETAASADNDTFTPLRTIVAAPGPKGIAIDRADLRIDCTLTGVFPEPRRVFFAGIREE